MKTILELGLALNVLLLFSSCVCIDYGRGEQTIQFRIDGPATDISSVTATTSEGNQSITPVNGIYTMRLPWTRWGRCMVLYMPVSGEGHPEKSETILVKKGDKVVKKVSVACIRKLPQESDGVYILSIK